MSERHLFKLVSFPPVLSEQQRSKDAPAATSGPRASDSGTESRHPPSSAADNGPKPPSGKPGRAEEGGSGWGGQGAPANYQVHLLDHNRKVSSVRRSMLGCRRVEKANLHMGQCAVALASVDYCGGEWLTICLHTGAQAWIVWSPGAALPPTRAAPWTRALLLLPTGRPSGLGLIDKSFVPLSHPPPTSLMESHLSVLSLHFDS